MNETPDLSHYRRMLEAGGRRPSARGLESVEATSSNLDFSNSAISDRLGTTGQELHEVVRNYLDDASDLHDLVDEIVKQGGTALSVVAEDDHKRFVRDDSIQAGLEVIVRTDGSRPSFMVRNRTVDLSTSPVGSWEDEIKLSRSLLDPALACVGRIDLPDYTHGVGTGFLIQDDLILTNRHVLQVIAAEVQPGTWTFAEGAAIDFGHEFRGTKQYPRRVLKRVVFCGREPIDFDAIDHKKLDLALIELTPGAPADKPNAVLAIDSAPDWADEGTTVYIAGYPAPPRPGIDPATLLEKLFQRTFGHKRLAPGEVMTPAGSVAPWTVTHDATTLGGNSGSVVLVAGRERIAAGLHYGGTTKAPRENWGHALGRVLDQTDGCSPKTLREHFQERGVELVDRNIG